MLNKTQDRLTNEPEAHHRHLALSNSAIVLSMPRLLFSILFAGSLIAADPTLFRTPTINQTDIVFAYAGDLWSVHRGGGQAQRLTSGMGAESNPLFSPDGKTIAFSGEYDGNVDVFTIPAAGGIPKRLTWHPSPDVAVGWTPDGTRILFQSRRNSINRAGQLFTVPREGGLAEPVPLFQAEDGSFSPDQKRIAYTPLQPAFDMWKRYRGGQTSYIQIANLSDSSVEKIPRQNSNDFYPMWIGNSVYFLSDRNGSFTLFQYDVAKKQVREAIHNEGKDLKSASAGPGAIVYEQFGSIYLYDLKTGKSQMQEITLAGDLPEVRPHFVNVSSSISGAAISPTGVRAAFEARGDIYTVPAEKGDIRNLTNTPGAHERSPAWSPDGKSIAWFSDESGENQLYVGTQDGQAPVRKFPLDPNPSFYYRPVWSPDSKKIAYSDKHLSLWIIDLDKGTPVKVDTDPSYDRLGRQGPDWSPDSKWLAYTKTLKNRMTAIFIYSVETGKTTQITDGMSEADNPLFDRGGKYLYFTASTDIGPLLGEGLSRLGRRATSSIYCAVLDKSLPSPIAPESDEEKADADKKADDQSKTAEKAQDKDKVADTKIDFDNIAQRTVALPLPPRDYIRLAAGKTGVLFAVESSEPNLADPGPPVLTVQRFDLKTRKTEKAIDGVASFILAANGEKMLVRQKETWSILPATAPPKAGEGALKLERMEVQVDPVAEWREMYREVWRGERDFFYDPNHHGLNLKAAADTYQPYLQAVASRADLNYLFREMLGNMTVSHLRANGGDQPNPKRVRGGLLGADYKVENGRYRFEKVYNGESWNPQLRAPLTQPGVNVAAGEYLLAVRGVDLVPPRDIDELLESTAGKSVRLRVGPDPSGANSREVTVVPIDDETALRNRAWIEDNRRKVDQLSGGKIAYVYLPNTSAEGFVNFNRYFFSQLDRRSVVIDERFNGGGALADYVIDFLRRPLLNFVDAREGDPGVMPFGSIFGPKTMLINEYAGSGGDAMPYYFRKMGVGPLIGKRTWGGLVRSDPMPSLIDGGVVTAPPVGLWSETGEWVAENKGIAPDIEVEQDPAAVRAGRDPQLERAVQYLLDEMKKNPEPEYKRPPYSTYGR
jgi:tricorn protease